MSFSPPTKKVKSGASHGRSRRASSTQCSSATTIPVCAGCRDQILDQYILRVAPDLEWHQTCLRCVECSQQLDETCTCFVRDQKPYCKRDYTRLFGARCAQCCVLFNENDLIMRTRNKIYHMSCFRCAACNRQLVSGDEFCLRADEGLVCKADYDSAAECLEQSEGNASELSSYMFDNDSNDMKTTLNNNNNEIKVESGGLSLRHADSLAATSVVAPSGGSSSRSGSRSHKSDQKTTRVRTVLNEKQLHTLRTCYGANPRPDALMKEQLVEMTGLSPRVIRVWFQNKRCKDKKRSILMKQMQQQQQEKGEICDLDEMWLCQKGVPMVATSPVRHEPPTNLQLAPIEVHHQCQPDLSSVGSVAPPWKALSDFALQTELDQPPFQQLVSSFGESSGDEDDDTVVCLEEPSRVRKSHTTAITSLKPLPSGASMYHHHHHHHHHQSSSLYPSSSHCNSAISAPNHHHQLQQSMMYSSLVTADTAC